MKCYRALICVLFLVSACNPDFLLPQQFGKNHVQYTHFKSYYLQSQHFDIYFTENGRTLAEFAAEAAEDAYHQLRDNFNFELTDRITIIVYNSHNDFEQTNVVLAPGEESVGGFTEFYKNRIVVPFEGEWEKFRHVIHHELTHAVMLQMMYGSGFQAIIAGLMQFQLPLWFIEGMAEYQSRGWDIESDDFMRDAALNGYLPALPYLNGFFAYKGGQSVFRFIAQTYGRERIADLLNKIRFARNLDAGLLQSIGLDVQGLNAAWHKYLKKTYWPDIASHKEPAEFARQLTDHRREGHSINNSPAFSPDGRRIAYLSDRSDYFDIYVADVDDPQSAERLIAGQQSGKLEELHWLRPCISWSPNGQLLVFAAKAGQRDVLHIVDVGKKKIVRTLKFSLDGAFSPSWSPGGDVIAFCGILHGQSDIYEVEIESGSLRQLTNDIFSDIEPSYSPDGSRLAFVSDRGDHLNTDRLPDDFAIHHYDYHNYDVYILQTGARNDLPISRITDTPFWEKSPVFSPDGQKLAFASDRSGIFNIYVQKPGDSSAIATTNLVSSAGHLSWSRAGDKLAFAAFSNAGYDLFVLDQFSHRDIDQLVPKTSQFISSLKIRRSENTIRSDWINVREDRMEGRFGRYFLRAHLGDEYRDPETESWAFLENKKIKDDNGDFKINQYKPRFSPDFAFGTAVYSQLWGVQGAGQIALSDVFGNHRLLFFTNLYYDFGSSDYLLNYLYLPRRIDLGIGAFHQAFFFNSRNEGLMRDRYFGLNTYGAYPFDRFKRLEASLAWLGINREYLENDAASRKIRVLLASAAYVRDTSAWGWTGPVHGERSEFRVNFSPRLHKDEGIEFLTLRGDYRKYFKIGQKYSLAVRVAGGASAGKNPQRFYLGGVDNWLNQDYSHPLRIDNPEAIYFSSFELPLRGTSFFESSGNRFVLTNLEFRFPLIRRFELGWPVRITANNIRGVFFTDLGAGWDRTRGKERFQPFRSLGGNHFMLNDLKMGYGLGAHINFGFLLLRIDIAWSTDWRRTASTPRYYFSLGSEF